MNLLSWNVQGLGNTRTFQGLKHMLKVTCPDVFFLMETRLHRGECTRFEASFQNYNIFTVDAVKRSGGLILGWKKAVNLHVYRFSLHCCIFNILNEQDDIVWRGAGIYGWPEAGRKELTWDLMNYISKIDSKPLVMFGDFNEILNPVEKWGGRPKELSKIEAFQNCVDQCQIKELGFSGANFTWSNGRSGNQLVMERLDRCFVNNEGDLLFPIALVFHLPKSNSDHLPILIDLKGQGAETQKRKRIFRFEAMWLRDSRCKEVISKAWKATDGQQVSVQEKLKRCATELSRWNRTEFGHIGRLLKQKREQISALQEGAVTEETQRQIKMEAEAVSELLAREEEMWRQRSRVDWLRGGDSNTKFFHLKASARRKSNALLKLQNESGEWFVGDDRIGELVHNFYSELFTSSDPSTIESVVQSITSRVGEENKEMLSAPYTREEVEAAIRSINPEKAPGPDGMTSMFYQKNWEVVGQDVVALVLNCLETGVLPEGINHTHVTLIPKVKHPTFVKDLRPISLCNVLYKIVSKVLASRMKLVLPELIYYTQSAFVPGRLITDNALVAFEIFHSMQTRLKGKAGYFALKLDMSKAYDRVEWSYLESVMTKMEFPERFRNLIMQCLSTVSFSFLVNGQPKGFLKPERGLRQGDPISPYLSLLCAEGLSSLLRKAEERKLIHGIKISTYCPVVTHLFFADDAIIFGKAIGLEGRRVQDILKHYERASGQCVNFDKSELSFSKKVEPSRKDQLKSIFHAKEVGSLPKYLGIPTVVGRSRNDIFEFIKERLMKRINGWSEKFLSNGGKEILIKAVAQAIPTYIMSCFRLTDTFCDDLQKIISRFWWKSGESNRPLHWLSWDALCSSKKDGGIGFRWLSSFNLAMLAKQAWRFLSNPYSLCSRVFQGKYFANTIFMEAEMGRAPSYIWRGIIESRELLQRGLGWKVGDGLSIRPLKDRWVPGLPCFHPLSCSAVPNLQNVKELIDTEAKCWKRNVVLSIFPPDEATQILKIPISRRLPPDRYVWLHSKAGDYTVKTGYYLSEQLRRAQLDTSSSSSQSSGLWNLIWRLQVPLKVKHFAWNACRGILPCAVNLARRHLDVELRCGGCGAQLETDVHILKSCRMAVNEWKIFPSSIRIDKVTGVSLTEWMSNTLKVIPRDHFPLFITVAWLLWFKRNRRIHGTEGGFEMPCVEKAAVLIEEWRKAQEKQDKGNRPVPTERWQPPPDTLLKMNIDAAFTQDGSKCGAGVIVRNQKGEVMLTAGVPTGSCLSPEVAEAVALREGVQMAIEAGFFSIQVEVDAKNIADAMEGRVRPTADCSMILEDVADFRRSFQFITFIHTNRSNNKPAHELAKWGSSLLERDIRLEEAPSFLAKVVMDDVIVL